MAFQAPGKHFRKGLTIIDLFRMFPDDAAAEARFESSRWGANREHMHCPRCGRPPVARKQEAATKPKPKGQQHLGK